MENKKMKYSNIIALQEKTFKKKEVTITAAGEDFKIVIEQKFKETEIAKLIGELVERSDYAKKMNYDFNILGHIMILIIKHFTDIQFPATKNENIKKDYENEVRMLNALIDLGLLDKIIGQFDQEEFNKIMEAFEKYRDSLRKLNNNELSKDLEAQLTVHKEEA